MKNSCLIKTFTTSLLLIQLTNALSQSVCIDSILINGSIKKYMQYSDFIQTDLKIDSIIKPDRRNFSDAPDSIIYVGESIFYLDSKNRCDAKSIWFDKISSVKLGKYSVNSSTTYRDLLKMFPTGCANTKSIKHVRFRGTILETCGLTVIDSKGQLWDMRIIFFLRDNKLIGLDFWEPI